MSVLIQVYMYRRHVPTLLEVIDEYNRCTGSSLHVDEIMELDDKVMIQIHGHDRGMKRPIRGFVTSCDGYNYFMGNEIKFLTRWSGHFEYDFMDRKQLQKTRYDDPLLSRCAVCNREDTVRFIYDDGGQPRSACIVDGWPLLLRMEDLLRDERSFRCVLDHENGKPITTSRIWETSPEVVSRIVWFTRDNISLSPTLLELAIIEILDRKTGLNDVYEFEEVMKLSPTAGTAYSSGMIPDAVIRHIINELKETTTNDCPFIDMDNKGAIYLSRMSEGIPYTFFKNNSRVYYFDPSETANFPKDIRPGDIFSVTYQTKPFSPMISPNYFRVYVTDFHGWRRVDTR